MAATLLIAGVIANGSQVVSLIAASNSEQARGVEHMGTAMSRIESVTQNNVGNAQQAAESAAAMDSEAQRTRLHLDQLVAVVGFKR